MPTSLDAEFSVELDVGLKEGEKSARLTLTSIFVLTVQARIEVGEPNADFSIPAALFIVGRGFADFSSRQVWVESGSSFADFTCFAELGVALVNLATAVSTSVEFVNSKEVCNGFADFISDAGEQ